MSDQERDGRPYPEQEPEPDDLLAMPEEDAAKLLFRWWNESWTHVREYDAQWTLNLARSAGYLGARLVKRQDVQQAVIPNGAMPSWYGMNLALRLKEQLTSQMFADPATPEATPSTDSDEDTDAAETATRVLQSLCGEGDLDYNTQAAESFDVGSDYGSGFQHIYTDPNGGGWQPEELLADPRATEKAHPFPVDPETGQPDPDFPHPMVPNPQVPGTMMPIVLQLDPITRYVKTDGTLTDERTDPDVAKQWLPGLRIRSLTSRSIRFLPYTARDIWEAEGVLIGDFEQWSVLKGLYPELENLPDDKQQAVLSERPQHSKGILAPTQRERLGQAIDDDSALVFRLICYMRQSAKYPKGACVIAFGGNVLGHREAWWDAAHQAPMDLPVTQFKQFREFGNPYGVGVMQKLGPGHELRAMMKASMITHLDRFDNRKVFVPLTSNLTPEQLQESTATYLNVMPGGEPKVEDVPDFPRAVTEMYGMETEEMQQEVNLSAPTQGQPSSNVSSGAHANLLVQQDVASRSNLRENTERALVRGWRIMLQQMRAFFTLPQEIKFLGDDGAYKVKRWSASDLGNTKDVRIARGSFSGMTAVQKAQMAQGFYLNDKILTPPEYRKIVATTVGGIIALQDDPHRMRVRRQIARWQQGPPQGTGDPMQDQTALQQAAQQVFAPLPVDANPQVAQVREFELGRALASVKAERFPPPWTQALQVAYEAARQAAGITTVAEQQRAQAQAAQSQQQAAQQAAQQKAQEQQVKYQTAVAKNQADLQTEQVRAAAEVRSAELAAQANALEAVTP